MLAHPLNLLSEIILVIYKSRDHIKMVTQKKISDYARKPVSKVGSNESSSAIVIIDSSDDEVIEDCESFGSTSYYPPSASLCDNEHENSDVSERTNDQSSSCSSDEEGIDNVQGDVNIQVNASELPNASNGDCTCRGCTDLSNSHQPKDVNKSKLVHSHNSKERQDCKKTYCRKILSSWYEKYLWITMCPSNYRIFCRTCHSAQQQGLLSSSVLSSKSGQSPFITGGFGN